MAELCIPPFVWAEEVLVVYMVISTMISDQGVHCEEAASPVLPSTSFYEWRSQWYQDYVTRYQLPLLVHFQLWHREMQTNSKKKLIITLYYFSYHDHFSLRSKSTSYLIKRRGWQYCFLFSEYPYEETPVHGNWGDKDEIEYYHQFLNNRVHSKETCICNTPFFLLGWINYAGGIPDSQRLKLAQKEFSYARFIKKFKLSSSKMSQLT